MKRRKYYKRKPPKCSICGEPILVNPWYRWRDRLEPVCETCGEKYTVDIEDEEGDLAENFNLAMMIPAQTIIKAFLEETRMSPIVNAIMFLVILGIFLQLATLAEELCN